MEIYGKTGVVLKCLGVGLVGWVGGGAVGKQRVTLECE